jgi:hypothetical protein
MRDKNSSGNVILAVVLALMAFVFVVFYFFGSLFEVSKMPRPLRKAAAYFGIKPGGYSTYVKVGTERVKQLNRRVAEDDKPVQDILKKAGMQ